MRLTSVVFLFSILIFLNCQSEHETFIERINQLVHLEKYDKALDLLKEKLESKRDSDEVISRNTPRRERIIRTSEDRNRILWSEDERLIFRDIVNPMVKTWNLSEPPQDIHLSSNGEYSVISLRLKNTKGCRMFAYSVLDDSLEYESGAHISCRNNGSISTDGKYLYYFIDENLYKERTNNPKSPLVILESSKIPPPFPKLKNKYSIVPIDKNFLILAGIAGSYNLYFFDSRTNQVDLISKDIVSPKTYYAHGKTIYVISGNIGNWYLREVNYKAENKPKILQGFKITAREIEPWKMTQKDYFISYFNRTVFKWGPMVPRKSFPLLCENALGIGLDMILYENKEGELILSNTNYSEEEWKILELYQNIQKISR